MTNVRGGCSCGGLSWLRAFDFRPPGLHRASQASPMGLRSGRGRDAEAFFVRPWMACRRSPAKSRSAGHRLDGFIVGSMQPRGVPSLGHFSSDKRREVTRATAWNSALPSARKDPFITAPSAQVEAMLDGATRRLPLRQCIRDRPPVGLRLHVVVRLQRCSQIAIEQADADAHHVRQ